MKKKLKISKINREINVRVDFDSDIINEYAAAQRGGVKMPDPEVYYDGSTYWLTDGGHRMAAAEQNGKREFMVEIKKGSKRDAILAAVKANATHGARRTNADKRKAVTMLLEDPELTKFSDYELAKRSLLARSFVQKIRKELSSHGGQTEDRTRSVSRGDSSYTMTLPPPPPTRKRDKKEEDSASPLPPPPPTKKVEQTDAVVVDEIGRIVPDDLVDIWFRKDEAQGLLTRVSKIKSEVQEAQNRDDVLFAGVNFNDIIAHLEQAYASLTVAKPYALCPMCHGDGCQACYDRGFVSKFHWNTTIPQEFKDIAIEEGGKNG